MVHVQSLGNLGLDPHNLLLLLVFGRLLGRVPTPGNFGLCIYNPKKNQIPNKKRRGKVRWRETVPKSVRKSRKNTNETTILNGVFPILSSPGATPWLALLVPPPPPPIFHIVRTKSMASPLVW